MIKNEQICWGGMKITNIGGATAILEHKGRRMLFDPWMNEGILYGSWYHFPPLRMSIRDLGHLDYIYISHIHEDHCAPGTIKHLNKNAEIIVMHREPRIRNFVLKFLKNNGFDFKKIHLIAPYTPTEIAPGMTVDMIEAPKDNEYNYLVDSGLVLKWDGFVIYNANDCPPSSEGLSYIQKVYQKVDLALLPYSGGSGYPGCYSNLSHEEKLKEKNRIFEMGMKMFTDAVSAFKPVRVMPFADQYVIGGCKYATNQYSPHPPCPGHAQESLRALGMKDRLLLLNSAQTFDFETGTKTPDEPYRLFTEEDRMKYAESLKDRAYDYEILPLNDGIPLERLFVAARKRLWEAQRKKNFFTHYHLYFDVMNLEKRFHLPLHEEKIEEVGFKDEPQEPFIRLSGPSSLFVLMLINHISWNMADGAFFINYERRPNWYDPSIYAILNYLTV